MNVPENGMLRWIKNYWYLLWIALLFILRVFFWVSPSHAQKINLVYLWPGTITTIVLLLYGRKEKLPQGAALTIGLFAWLLFSCLVNGDAYLEYNHTFLLGVLICFVGCYVAIPTLDPQKREHGFAVLAYVYVGLMLIIAILSIYAAITGVQIRTPFSDASIRITSNRLFVFNFHPNEIGCAFSIAIFLLFYLVTALKNFTGRACGVLACIVLYICIALTVSRTAMIITAVGCGLFAFFCVYHVVSQKKYRGGFLAGTLALAATFVICYFGLTLSIQLVGMAAETINVDISSEQSAIKNTAVVHLYDDRKEYKDIGTFNMRTDIWKAGLTYLKENPRALLFGTPDNVVSRIPSTIGRPEFHMHNAFLEMLLLGGIPGFSLFAGFIYVLCRSAIRLVFAKETPLRGRYLATLPVLLMLNWTMEIYPLFSGNVMDMMYFVLASMVISMKKGRPSLRRSKG